MDSPRRIFTIVTLIEIMYTNSASLGWDQSRYSRDHSSKFHRSRRDAEDPLDVPISPRIIGGRPVRFGETPHQVRLENDGHFFCGGSILDHCGFRFIVTSAHCVWSNHNSTSLNNATIPVKNLYAVAADLKKDSWQPREQWFGIAEIVVHQDYDPRFALNDIALLRVDRFMQESLGLEHIQLPDRNWVDPDYVQSTGWGSADHFAGKSPDELQLIELPVLPWEKCKLLPLFGWLFLSANQFCIANPEEDRLKGLCDGDSGGPATSYNWTLQKWYLAGTNSYISNFNCGSWYTAGILTRMTDYVDWVKGYSYGWLQRYGTGNEFHNDSYCNPFS